MLHGTLNTGNSELVWLKQDRTDGPRSAAAQTVLRGEVRGYEGGAVRPEMFFYQ